LINFRGALIKELLRSGYKVTAVANDADEKVAVTLAEWVASFVPLKLDRTGMNPLADLGTIIRLVRLMKRRKPDIFIGYTLKPVTYGLISARIANVPLRYAMITGLGYAFTEGNEVKRKVARVLSSSAYGIALRFADGVIFQNAEDEREFHARKFLSSGQKVIQVNGSGVDLKSFSPRPMPGGPITFLMIARLLKDKGVYDYIEAAQLVKQVIPDARFLLVGPLDANPTAISKAEVDKLVQDGIIEYLGELTDVRPAIENCHVYVLPSFREGMPRTVLEAMAMRRPIISTNVPGCRAAIAHGENGLLVPPRDARELAKAMCVLANDADLRERMASSGLLKATREYGDSQIAEQLVHALQISSGGKGDGFSPPARSR